MKYCQKCDSRRPEDHLFCYQCNYKLLDKPKTNEEKIAMLKIILKEAHADIRKCGQHDAKALELASECLNCWKTAFSSFKEISEIVLNGNGKSNGH